MAASSNESIISWNSDLQLDFEDNEDPNSELSTNFQGLQKPSNEGDELYNIDCNVDLSFTIAVVGADESGKRSFLRKVCGEENVSKVDIRRKQIIFKSKVLIVNDLVCKVNFWCAPGDENWRSRSCKLLSNVAGVIALFDVTEKYSLISAKTWLEELDKNRHFGNHKRDFICKKEEKKKRDRPPTFLVGNKTDLNAFRRVHYSDGSDAAYGFSVEYYEVTCQNLPKVKEDVEEELLQEEEKYINDLLKKSDSQYEATNLESNERSENPKSLPQAPVNNINESSVTDRNYQACLNILSVPPDLLLSLHINVHRPLYISLPSNFEPFEKQLEKTENLEKQKTELPEIVNQALSHFGDDGDGILMVGKNGNFIFCADGISEVINDSNNTDAINKTVEIISQGENEVNYFSRLRYNAALDRRHPKHEVASQKVDWL
ncbi:EF-hand calcium-binding domain-containing protein 4B [Clydaea vesicula]|uniref:EF-hand calcium-binding domain-containing protein 4B n=1 Tax=Clydaea vesicula TaxID=447962 RepID=A0AAD5U359_9FUNG|nr:EF-hand calcium-binding domain-containing protein 4B [Clydaea vesicula]